MARPILRPVPEGPPRAVVYVRQSQAREDSISLELQETACRDYCAKRGYDVVALEADPGVSGLKWDRRPGVQRVMAAVAARDVDVVVVWRWSRLSRSRLHQAVALEEIERAGARVESATEPFDTSTAGGEFGRDVMLAAAHFESRQKAEQWREAHERRRRLGLPAQGGDRFAYVRRDDGTYEPDPVLGEVLAWMYRTYIDGAGFTAIARQLNAQGHRTGGGSTWERTRVSGVLDSGFGAGLIPIGKGPRATHVPGAHEPVIDEATWAAFRRARTRRATEPPASTEPRYWLSGLMRCGDCGSSMDASRLGVRAGYAFLCARWARSGEGRCVTVTRAKAEAAVLAWLREVAGDVGARAAAEADRAAARTLARQDARALARKVAALDAQLHRLTVGFAEGAVPAAAYASARAEIEASRVEVAARLSDAELVAERAAGRVGPVARSLLDDWDELPVRGRRDVLRTLVGAVVVHRGETRGDVTVEVVGVGA